MDSYLYAAAVFVGIAIILYVVSQRQQDRTVTLDLYAKDLTALARKGELDPVIGRGHEIRRVIQILSRRTKNNPVLIGNSGVGKTAIVEELANEIASNRVPTLLRGKRLLALDLAGLVAGTKFRGEFEKRLKLLTDEIIRGERSIILFIDELHTLAEAGEASGAIDAAEILKPALARGELQVIGASTPKDYQEYIAHDLTLERRFQPVAVEEPTVEETRAIVRGLRQRYEQHHHVRITEEALDAAVHLSAERIPDRHFPDKAIDIIDEACAKVRLDALDAAGTKESVVTDQDILEVITEWERDLKLEARFAPSPSPSPKPSGSGVHPEKGRPAT